VTAGGFARMRILVEHDGAQPRDHRRFAGAPDVASTAGSTVCRRQAGVLLDKVRASLDNAA
jgi:hypothetical protein